MKRFFSYFFGILLLASCCHQQAKVDSVETSFIEVDSTLDAIQDSSYIAYLQPIHDQLEQQLNIPLGQAPDALWVGQPESPLLNWSCDALLEEAHLYYDGRIDMAVVNVGGLRCEWPAGDITFRNVFELMPFDNELVILTLSGNDILLLAENCVKQGGQGVSAAFRVQGKGTDVVAVSLNGKSIDPQADYFVATSDYLSGGADGLIALTLYTNRHFTGKKIRDLYIEYIARHNVVEAHLDGRMFIEK